MDLPKAIEFLKKHFDVVTIHNDEISYVKLEFLCVFHPIWVFFSGGGGASKGAGGNLLMQSSSPGSSKMQIVFFYSDHPE